MISRFAGFAAAAMFACSLAGCTDGESTPKPPVMGGGHDHGHDHGHGQGHPETLAGAYAQVTALRDTVRDAFKEGDADAAHGPLHDVGHLLEDLQVLADKAELSDEAKATIKTNVDILFESFGAVDDKMHDPEEGSDYSEVSEKIDAAIAAIGTAAGPLAEGGEHDHGHDDHEDGDHDHDGEHKDDDHDHDEKPSAGEKKE